MYLIFAIIGLVICGLTDEWDGGTMAMGALIGFVVGVVFKFLFKVIGSYKGQKLDGAFDGCLLFIFFEAILQGLSD